ncbi:hypothetical protein JCM16303_006415 [Sporobolomyces ruberrimus]
MITRSRSDASAPRPAPDATLPSPPVPLLRRNTATLSDLPDEILLEILLDEELDYLDIKRISGVCKALHRLEQDHSLDAQMFRGGLPAVPLDQHRISRFRPDLFELHPILEYVESIWLLREDFSPRALCHHVRKLIARLSCMDDRATRPACSRITWDGLPEDDYYDESVILPSYPSGVRVKQVMGIILRRWERQCGEEMRGVGTFWDSESEDETCDEDGHETSVVMSEDSEASAGIEDSVPASSSTLEEAIRKNRDYMRLIPKSIINHHVVVSVMDADG